MSIEQRDRVERRLAAILAADVVAYSRLMGADEVGTLEQLKAHRAQLVDPKIWEHHGRIVKTTGDGMLVEFASVVDAVRCAVEVQRGMIDRNSDVPEERRVCFRVGINLGDVIIDGDDIHGDGVNVAARLEGLAEPGGLCVSRTVRNQVRDKLPYAFEDMGEQSVKNIARPVRADALSAAAVAETLLVPTVPQPQSGAGHLKVLRRPTLIAVSSVATVVIGLGAWWVLSHTGRSPAVVQTSVSSQSTPTSAVTPSNPLPRLSIVVLPFTNLSNDPDQEYFADGITDDLTTDLSLIMDSFVIARTTAFTYKGKPIDVKQIGKELGVRYVLEGSVRRDNQQVQVNVQLIDAETGAHVWADRFETDRTNLAKAQDEIVGRLARSLQLEMVEAAARRIDQEKPVNPDASDFVMRGWAWYFRPRTDETLQEAQGAFESALRIDPQSTEAAVGLATVLTEYVANGRRHVVNGASISPEEDMARSDQLLLEALQQGTRSGWAYFAVGRLRRLQGRLADSRTELERGIELNPNDASTILQLGITLLFIGQPGAALPYFEKAILLTPRSPNVFYFYQWLGHCQLVLGQLDRAIDNLRRARAANPRAPGTLLYLSAALGLRGDVEEARNTLNDLLKLRPEDSSLAQLRTAVPNWDASPQYVALREQTVDVGLRQAGMPDE